MKINVDGATKVLVFAYITERLMDYMYEFRYEHPRPESLSHHIGTGHDIGSLINEFAINLRQSAEVVTLESKERDGKIFKVPLSKGELSSLGLKYRQKRRELIANID